MQSDMYNLYPAIGAVNALRSNYNYAMLPAAKVTFGTCPMKIEDRRAEPPEYTRGTIGRTMLYMADSYPKMRLSDQQRKLAEAWAKQYAPDAWECTRAKRIARRARRCLLTIIPCGHRKTVADAVNLQHGDEVIPRCVR